MQNPSQITLTQLSAGVPAQRQHAEPATRHQQMERTSMRAASGPHKYDHCEPYGTEFEGDQQPGFSQSDTRTELDMAAADP